LTLADALEAAAADLAGVSEAEPEPGTTEWTLAGRPFAAIRGGTAEFLLEGIVARAALGTPDTKPSPRGQDWVAFTPPELDRFALDRAASWLASAHRHASRGSTRNR